MLMHGQSEQSTKEQDVGPSLRPRAPQTLRAVRFKHFGLVSEF